jgi:hypothetical protein
MTQVRRSDSMGAVAGIFATIADLAPASLMGVLLVGVGCVLSSVFWWLEGHMAVPAAIMPLSAAAAAVAGARRYLLRIETSNPELYAALHPDSMSWQRRVDCLKDLQDVGYMVRRGLCHRTRCVCLTVLIAP